MSVIVKATFFTYRIGDLRPIDFLLIALAYGLGVGYLDKYGLGEYVISCEIENNNLRCISPCSGNEDRCLFIGYWLRVVSA